MSNENRIEMLQNKLAKWPRDERGIPKDWKNLLLTHLEVHRPAMFKTATASGELEELVQLKVQNATEEFNRLQVQGATDYEAWETVQADLLTLQ